MTDRELMELAAKAASINVKRDRLEDPVMRDFLVRSNDPDASPFVGWNPLTDDGDALRLAVKLCMSLLIGDGGTVAVCIDHGEHSVKAVERYLPDPPAATRRAIVRAAAEIGKSMP